MSQKRRLILSLRTHKRIYGKEVETMKDYLKEKITNIADGNLTSDQIEDLSGFFKQVLSKSLDQDDEPFFRELAYEMTGDLKDLALLLIEFRQDLKSKLCPEITDLAVKYIPQAADQLEGVIETLEAAANKLMDNLETMQARTDKIGDVFNALKTGKISLSNGNGGAINHETIETISPVIKYMESEVEEYNALVSDSFVQMSFQDLTGQRIKRIMALVTQIEDRLRKMIISFGIKLTERGKNPDISSEDLQRAVDEKVCELAGPQREGDGLDQSGIDDLLANL
jgi:chemotaxis protein CheZ